MPNLPPPTQSPTPQPEPKSNKRVYILLAVFIIVLLAGISYMFITLKQNPGQNFLSKIKEKYQAHLPK